ncbi:MAG: hypothetical protein CMQ24_04490 [Gammaproteobacteria bacterium]|nr:hypothetical protein [Gammaproteobacteria bacterium]
MWPGPPQQLSCRTSAPTSSRSNPSTVTPIADCSAVPSRFTQTSSGIRTHATNAALRSTSRRTTAMRSSGSSYGSRTLSSPTIGRSCWPVIASRTTTSLRCALTSSTGRSTPTGWKGRTGTERASRTAWWARSGLMDHVRRPLGAHSISAPGMGDHATCMSLFGGIMAALYRREKTSEGAHVYTSLLANGAWSHSMLIQGGLVGFDLSDQATPDDLKATPLATMYETSDDRTLLLCILNPVKEWAGFIRALGSPAWASEPRFADPEQRVANAADLHGLLADLFRNDTANHWRERLDAQAITYSIASNISDVINDEQLYANDILTPMSEGPQLYAHTVNSPIWIKGVEKTQPVAAPDVGQHTDAVLSELGLSGAEIDALVRAGTVGRSA